MASHYDVAIVGMGPAGAAAALFLGHEGLSVAVIEKAPDVYDLPRAVALDGEVIRAFQKIGYGHALADAVQTVRPGERAGFANSKREWLFGQELPEFGRNGWQPVSMFDQPAVEQFIREAVEVCEQCTVFLNEEVLELKQSSDIVTVLTNKQTLIADWVIACDGAASPTRKSLDIGWQDLGYDHDWLVVDITLNPGATLPPETLQVCDPERLVTYVGTVEPYRRWEFKLNPGETADEMLIDEQIEKLLAPWIQKDQYTLRRKAVYQFHAATADNWRDNRIFIAGDAAHQTPPFLGQGLNAGMRDVINIAWKIAMVQRGICAAALLDTYEAERSPHAQDLVEWAVSLGQLMEHIAATEDAQNKGLPEPNLPEQKQASGYGQGREAPPLRAGAIMVEQVSNEGSTGYLFCQPIVKNSDGATFKLDDLMGPGFALVAKEPIELDEASCRILTKLNMRYCTLNSLEPVQGHFDPLFDYAEAAIVRPDRYVFGHTTEQITVGKLLGELAEKLHVN